MERNRSIQRADSSIPCSLESEGRRAKRVPSHTQDRDQGPPSSIGVWPMQDCRDRALPSRHQPPLPPPSPPSQLINPLVMARFAILRGQRGSVADSGVARGSSSDVCRETRPPPPGRPARPCGLPHTPLLALPLPLDSMDPTSSTSCNVSLCSVLLSKESGNRIGLGRRERRVLLSPPSSFTNGLSIGMGGSIRSNGRVHPYLRAAPRESMPGPGLDSGPLAPSIGENRPHGSRVRAMALGLRAAGCGHDESRLGLARPSRETVR